MVKETNSVRAARHRQQISDILEASRTFGLHQPLDALLETVAAEVCRCSSYRMAVVNLVDEASGEIVVRAMAGVPPEGRRKLEGTRIPLHIVMSVLREEFRIGQSYFVRHDRRPEIPDLDQYIFTADLGERKLGEWQQEDMLVVPIQTLEEELLGYISVDDPSDRQLPSSDTVQALELLASVAATAIQNAQLYEQAQQEITERKRAEEALYRQNEYLAALHETALGLITRLELTDLLQTIVKRAGSLADTPHGYIYLLEPSESDMKVWMGIGVHSHYIGYRLKFGEGLAGKVWQTGQPLVVDDYSTWPDRVPNPMFDILHAVVGIPLKSSSQVIGVIGLAYVEEGRRFGDEEIAVLSQFAELASIALDNARLYATVKKELTERKRVEERLRLLSSAVEQSTEGMAVSDLEGNLLFVNNAFATLHGYIPGELVGKPLSIFHTPEQMPSVEAANQQTQEMGEFSGEIWHVRRDGTVFPSIMHNSLLRDEMGNPIGMIGTLRDITDRKRQETRLQDYLSTVTSSLAHHTSIEGLYEFIVEAGKRFLSTRDCSLFLVSDEDGGALELITTTALPLPADRPRIPISTGPRCGLVAHVAGTCQPIRLLGQEIFRHPSWNKGLWTRLRWDSDPEANHSLLAAPMCLPNGRLVGVLVARDGESREGFSEFDEVLIKTLANNAAADIERVRGLEKTREDAIRAERKRLETDLHEAMNVLATGVRWEAEILSEEIERSDLAAECIALTRLQAALASAYTDLRYLLEDLRDPTLEQKGLLIALKKRAELIGRGRVVVHSDFRERLPPEIEGALYRVGQETMSNAVKHSGVVHDPEVKIEVWLERSNGQVKLCVKDNGVGFDVESTLALSHKWGLRRLSDTLYEMGGRLDIDSVPGKGTTICATIDLRMGNHERQDPHPYS